MWYGLCSAHVAKIEYSPKAHVIHCNCYRGIYILQMLHTLLQICSSENSIHTTMIKLVFQWEAVLLSLLLKPTLKLLYLLSPVFILLNVFFQTFNNSFFLFERKFEMVQLSKLDEIGCYNRISFNVRNLCIS